MTKILSGKEVTENLNAEIKKDADLLREGEIEPCLAIVRIGENPDDISYENGAVRRAETVGVNVQTIPMPENAKQPELVSLIKKINADESIHGVLLLRPLPEGMDENLVRNVLVPEKDVDGITDFSAAGVFTGEAIGFPPCTARACMRILGHYKVDLSGKRTVIIGRSQVVGKPVAMMLLEQNATVTVCHTYTKDLEAEIGRADIVIAAAGKAGAVKGEWLTEGQTVIDVGINVDDEGKLHGDVDHSTADNKVAAITPVPGGVGTVTTSILMRHVVDAAMRG
ncbi:MAG: bifunctional 5,10-methylenetetrahydrofolate dehydrogenase/5,10-methenyltetrahydrofolate cyclohydrolase [Eubacteriaceae bacterium]|nr:bifunctional 5,10-methylenetetrahydrofolate dehydrogenase/5,10-methenyltetrahydrofolate cyclohydrolase [Eubacteriaceae bacterium]